MRPAIFRGRQPFLEKKHLVNKDFYDFVIFTCYAANEFEIGNMVWIAQTRVWVDLKSIIIHRRILEESVVRIKHFFR